MAGFSAHREQPMRPSLPAWLDRYTTLGLYGLVVGTGLCLLAFLTNPVPDPSFPWATLPGSPRLPVVQPRIEHWPVTKSIGIWLWIFCFPALFLEGLVSDLGCRLPVVGLFDDFVHPLERRGLRFPVRRDLLVDVVPRLGTDVKFRLRHLATDHDRVRFLPSLPGRGTPPGVGGT